jgi:hypothetical protein
MTVMGPIARTFRTDLHAMPRFAIRWCRRS